MDSLRIGDAVYCLGTTRGTLQQWLNGGGKVQLSGGYGRSWATFTLADIANLALTRTLAVDFNVPVAEAFNIAQAVIQQSRRPRAKGLGEEYWLGWQDHRLILRRDAKGEWSFTRVSASGRLGGVKHSRGTLAGNFLNIDVGLIVKSAIDRALDHAAARPSRRA